MAKVKEISETRKTLIENSVIARRIKKERVESAKTENEALLWMSKGVNDIIRDSIYNLKGKELKTFKQWKNDGATVKKGSKAFPFWGQPLQATSKNKKEAAGEEKTEESKYEYWPICLLFSEDQVVSLEDKQREVATEEKKEEVKECLSLDGVL